MLEDASLILRMVWHPAHFDRESGNLKGSAFDSRDLEPSLDGDGQSRYMSVDEAGVISRDSVDWRIAQQQRDGRREAHQRFDARFLEFRVVDVRSIALTSGSLAFSVTPDPLEAGADGEGSPSNAAHCAVRSLLPGDETKGAKRARVEYLRVKLRESVVRIRRYSDIFSAGAAA